MPKMTSGPGWSLGSDDEPRPAKKANPGSPVPKIRLEKRACGKFVTAISGLYTYGPDRLNEMARQLKSACGAGGTVKNRAIEIQGDKVKAIQAWFANNGKIV